MAGTPGRGLKASIPALQSANFMIGNTGSPGSQGAPVSLSFHCFLSWSMLLSLISIPLVLLPQPGLDVFFPSMNLDF